MFIEVDRELNMGASGKYHVTYLTLGIYVASVLLLTLLVTLLPSLAGVNRSGCSDSATTKSKSVVAVNNEEPIEIHKRNAPPTAAKVDYRTHPKTVKQIEKRKELRKQAEKNSFLQSRGKINGKQFKANDDCPEFVQYQNDTLWESIRLPTNVKPLRYDVEIYVPKFGDETYAGVETITIDITEDTKYIIFHAIDVDIEDGKLVDKNNVEIEIQCSGFYSLNDYFVLIAKNKIPKTSSPLKLELTFLASLRNSQEGFYNVEYQGGNSRYKYQFFFE